MQNSPQLFEFPDLCCNWTIWSVLSFLNIHYSFAGKVFFGQNKKNSCVLAVSSIYLLKDWGLAHQETESGPLNFYLFYLKLWLAPFISPCTNVRAPQVNFKDGMKLFHHQTVQRTALKPARATLENHCNQWLPDLKTKTFPYSPFLSSCTLVSKGDMSLSCDIFMSHFKWPKPLLTIFPEVWESYWKTMSMVKL